MNNKIKLPEFISLFDKKAPDGSLKKVGIIVDGNILGLYHLKVVKQ